MTIPMVDLKAQYEGLKQELDREVAAVLASGHFVLGPNVQALEQEAAAYCGVKHAITCASGTDALHLALRPAASAPATRSSPRLSPSSPRRKPFPILAPSRCSWTSIRTPSTLTPGRWRSR